MREDGTRSDRRLDIFQIFILPWLEQKYTQVSWSSQLSPSVWASSMMISFRFIRLHHMMISDPPFHQRSGVWMGVGRSTREKYRHEYRRGCGVWSSSYPCANIRSKRWQDILHETSSCRQRAHLQDVCSGCLHAGKENPPKDPPRWNASLEHHGTSKEPKIHVKMMYKERTNRGER